MVRDDGLVRLQSLVPPYLKVEILRLQLELRKRQSGEVIEELLEHWHKGARGNLSTWQALKGNETASGGGSDVE